jgi:hypothetical protein
MLDEGAISTEATGGGRTVTVAVPLCSPALAVIIAVPAPIAVTWPLELTDAIVAVLVAHNTSGAAPQCSDATLAARSLVSPTDSCAVAGVIVILETAHGSFGLWPPPVHALATSARATAMFATASRPIVECLKAKS